jgi:hypothetical protein
MSEKKIPRQLERYLERQQDNPLPAVFCDINKTGEVRLAFSYGGSELKGFNDIHEQKVGRWEGEDKFMRYTSRTLGIKTDEITAPCSVMKTLHAQGKVVVIGQNYESSVWDVYDIEGIRGYEPWPSAMDQSPYSSKLPVTEFDNLWVPVSGVPNGQRPFSYFKFWQYQLTPIKGLPAPWGHSGPMIDLPAALQRSHTKMVTAAY